MSQLSEAAEDRDLALQLSRVLEVVRDVRHEINSPLTAIMAEAELLLMDAEQLNQEQVQSLTTIVAMARRIRDLNAQLGDLGTDSP
jgi:signal transduction histidine kinase